MKRGFWVAFLAILGIGALALRTKPMNDFCAAERMKGLSFVAPPQPFSDDPMAEVVNVNANWIAVLPYAYTRTGTPSVRYNLSNWQWWGERPEGVRQTIELAHQSDISVLLKPHVYVPGDWSGNLEFESDASWQKWENDYTSYILEFAEMAEEMNVAAFCIGNEFKKSIKNRTAFWSGLIKKVRSKYSGKLLYAANWDSFGDIPIWDEVDIIGINAYFPLVDKKTPSVEDIKKAWQPVVDEIRKFHKKHNKPIVFSEFGYLSVDHCAGKTWELEHNIKSRTVNEQAQANAIQALFEIFWNEPYWLGGFQWKWFPEGQGHEGYPERDYTIQDKLGYSILKEWYAKCE